MLGKGLESLIPPTNGNKFGEGISQGESTPSSFPGGQNGFEEEEREHSQSSGEEKFSEVGFPGSNVYRRESEKLDSFPETKLESPGASSYPTEQEAVYLVETSKIEPNPLQPRKYFSQDQLKELAASIREYGVIQPLVVTKKVVKTELGEEVRYQLIAGERRLLASKMLGLEMVPVIIREIEEEKSRLEIAVIENLQREDLNPMETARALARLADEFGMSQREIALRVGRSREAVANTLRLLQLSKEAQTALEDGRITESHARLMLSFSNPEQQSQLLEEILKYGFSVKETQERAKEIARRIVGTSYLEARAQRRKATSKREAEPMFMEAARFLEEFLSTPVEIASRGKNGGKVTIKFFDKDHLKSLIEKITKKEKRLDAN